MQNTAVISVLLITFAVFLFTAAPTVYVGDNGELVAAGYLLGIPHPSGYPLFCVLGKFFSFMPLGNIAFRMNVMNAIFASLSLCMLFFVLKKLFNNFLTTLSTIAVFGFSTTFWEQLIVAEVYTLNIFFFIALLLLAMYIKEKFNYPRPHYLFWSVLGIGLANHHTLLLVILPVIVFLVLKHKLPIVLLLCLFFLGISLYLYLPVRSLANPSIDWGNPETIANFSKHILRKQYGSFSKDPFTIARFMEQTIHYLKFLITQFPIPFFLIFPLGIFLLSKKDKILFWILTASFVLGTLGMIVLTNFKLNLKELYVIKVFFIPSYLILAVFLGIGLDKIFSLVNKPIAVILAIIICVFSPFYSYSLIKIDSPYIAYFYGRNLLATPKQGGVIFTAGDNPMFSLAYLKMVEGMGNGITVYDDLGNVFENIYGDDFLFLETKEHDLRLFEKQIAIIENDNASAYFTLGSFLQKVQRVESVPVGMLYKVQKQNEKMQEEESRFWRIYNSAYKNEETNDYLIKEILTRYIFAKAEYFFNNNRIEEANKFYDKAREMAKGVEWIESTLGAVSLKRGLSDKAIEEYGRLIKADSKNSVAYNNIGVAYLQRGEMNLAVENFKKAIEVAPQYADAYNNLGNAYFKIGKKEEAKKVLEKAIEINPHQADALTNLGGLYFEQNNFKLSKEYFERALAENPRNTKALVNIGGLFFHEGNHNEAIKMFLQALKIEPNNADAHNNLGSVYGVKGEIEKAVKEWQEALKIDPNHENAKENLKKAEEYKHKK